MPTPRAAAFDALVAPASEAEVKARDKAILDVLKVRPWKTNALASVMPDEPTLSEDQRTVALNSALTRLRVKKLIVHVDGEWRLV